MKGLTLNSMPGVLAGAGMQAGGPVVSPIKKRKKRMDMAAASAAGKGGSMGIGMPQMPFGGALNK